MMSTQDDSGIEFSIVPEEGQQHFRLLELPSDLLSVITSEDAPILQLKSSEGPAGNALDSQAVLCTPDKTYSVRQVSTSNTVYIVQPGTTPSDSLPQTNLEAIARSQSTLELHPAKDVYAAKYIKAALPTYTSTGHHGSTSRLSKQQLFANIPLSDTECEHAWRDLACFESAEESLALMPSDSVKLKVWQAILTAATVTGIDITQPLNESDQLSVVATETEWPEELSKAVLRSMNTDTTNLEHIQLDGDKSARCIGQTLLKDLTNDGRHLVANKSFSDKWADLLPEKWRPKAEMKLLEGCYKSENAGQHLAYIENDGNSSSSNSVAPVEAKSTLGAKRKWHEKFRASKKTA